MSAGGLREKLEKAGYSQEDIFFYERDLELIEKVRNRKHLTLIPGGRVDDPQPKKSAQPDSARKAA